MRTARQLARCRRALATRRTALGIAAALAVLGLQATASAQDFPNRAITIVVPFGPGTGNDIIARQSGST
jgi:tripartite-type tricarboxylate transporter receptor subunit TctC